MCVEKELVGLGARQLGDLFHQGEFMTQNAVADIDLTSGFCGGVVLDWTRRVLQSDGTRDQKYLSYSTPGYLDKEGEQSKKKRRATSARMLVGYEGQTTSYVSETNKVKALGELRKLEKGVEVLYEDYGKGVPVPRDIAELIQKFWKRGEWPFDKFNFRNNPAGTLTQAVVKQLMADLDVRPDRQMGERSIDGRHWGEFAARLDATLRDGRAARGKQDNPKRLFSLIEVVRSSPQREYAEEGAWMTELMEHGFQPNCCTIISFRPLDAGGHQVAINQTGEDQFVLFDPNYGAFECSRSNVERCIQHLFWAPVRNAPQSVFDRNRAVYLRRKKEGDPDRPVWKKMGYTIFQKKAA